MYTSGQWKQPPYEYVLDKIPVRRDRRDERAARGHRERPEPGRDGEVVARGHGGFGPSGRSICCIESLSRGLGQRISQVRRLLTIAWAHRIDVRAAAPVGECPYSLDPRRATRPSGWPGSCAARTRAGGRWGPAATSARWWARSPLRLLITPSGADKGAVAGDQMVTIDDQGQATAGAGRPSAETSLHLAIVRACGARAVSHTHSVWSTLLSDAAPRTAAWPSKGTRCSRASRVTTHDASRVAARHREHPGLGGGGAAGGVAPARSAAHARAPHPRATGSTRGDATSSERHLEILEFLLEVGGAEPGRTRRTAMAVVRFPDEGRAVTDEAAVRENLARVRHRLRAVAAVAARAGRRARGGGPGRVRRRDRRLKRSGGYVTADVIDVSPQTPNLDAMLARFRKRALARRRRGPLHPRGRGVFHIHPQGRAGDGDRGRARRPPPRAARHPHWFDLCSERDIRAIRLFQDAPAGRRATRTAGVDARYQPVCLGPVVHSRRG